MESLSMNPVHCQMIDRRCRLRNNDGGLSVLEQVFGTRENQEAISKRLSTLRTKQERRFNQLTTFAFFEKARSPIVSDSICLTEQKEPKDSMHPDFYGGPESLLDENTQQNGQVIQEPRKPDHSTEGFPIPCSIQGPIGSDQNRMRRSAQANANGWRASGVFEARNPLEVQRSILRNKPEENPRNLLRSKPEEEARSLLRNKPETPCRGAMSPFGQMTTARFLEEDLPLLQRRVRRIRVDSDESKSASPIGILFEDDDQEMAPQPILEEAKKEEAEKGQSGEVDKVNDVQAERLRMRRFLNEAEAKSKSPSVRRRLVRIMHDIKSSKKKGDDSECCICMSKTLVQNDSNIDLVMIGKPESEIGRLACEHLFCFQCILDWSKVTNACPLCKRDFFMITKLSKEGLILCKVPVEEKKLKPEEFYAPEDQSNNIFHINEILWRIVEMDDNCYVCNSGEEENLLLLCDMCQFHVCHTRCLQMDRIPEGEWFCHFCEEREDEILELKERLGIEDSFISPSESLSERSSRSGINRNMRNPRHRESSPFREEFHSRLRTRLSIRPLLRTSTFRREEQNSRAEQERRGNQRLRDLDIRRGGLRGINRRILN